MRRLSLVLFSLFIIFGAWRNLYANDPGLQSIQESMNELKRTVKSLESSLHVQNEVIRQQSIQIAALQKEPGQVVPQTSSLVMPAGSPAVAGVSGFNPEIGVTGTVQTKLTQNSNDAEGNDTIALKELELNFAQVVDPFSRLDAIISFNDNIEAQNVNIEEAYYTRWELPLGFIGQIGKFRAKIGKENLMHLHRLDTTDYPLVIRDFFGEEGLAASSARLQNTIPNPWDLPIEITGEVLRGNNGPSFSGISRRPIFNTHLKTFFEPTKDTNLELGWTTLFGDEVPASINSKGSDKYGVKVFGADATFNGFLPEGRKIKWQNEVYFQNRGNVHVNDNPWGAYSLLDFRLSPKFSTGVRFDYLEPLDVLKDHRRSTGISPYFTFWQSEFADFKIQYSRFEPANGNKKSDNLLFLQADFLIGADKHPIQ